MTIFFIVTKLLMVLCCKSSINKNFSSVSLISLIDTVNSKANHWNNWFKTLDNFFFNRKNSRTNAMFRKWCKEKKNEKKKVTRTRFEFLESCAVTKLLILRLWYLHIRIYLRIIFGTQIMMYSILKFPVTPFYYYFSLLVFHNHFDSYWLWIAVIVLLQMKLKKQEMRQ